MLECPCCLDRSTTFYLGINKRCPVLNNVTYDTYDEAINSPIGQIDLACCNSCGLVFNASYDASLISYDASYNPSRSKSDTYMDYLDSIVEMLANDYLSRASRVLEIGCGHGEFLKKLSGSVGCSAEGYDTSYSGDSEYKGNARFFGTCYEGGNDASYDLLILRHVLEHIAKPKSFLEDLCSLAQLKRGSRLFIEVPSFDWIMQKKAFYDITYEHCNYFTGSSLGGLMRLLGFEVEKTAEVFGGQYLACVGVKSSNSVLDKIEVLRFAESINEFKEVKRKIFNTVEDNDHVSVWGAAGKGVVFLSDLPENILGNISHVIDINTSKQGRYLAGSGKMVESPEILKSEKGKALILIMNEIYENEILNKLNSMNVSFSATLI
jgi:SAM-dependent methyltransferase